MTTRCTHCGATLTWYAGQQFQVCWSCGKVTKRAAPEEYRDPNKIAPDTYTIGGSKYGGDM